MNIRQVGVVGAGTMGNGIAHAAAQSGYQVTMVDVSQELVEKAQKTIEANLDRMVRRDTIAPEVKEQTLSRIKLSTDIEDVASAQMVIEAAPEQVDLKLKVFVQLDSLCSAAAILCTNTSSIPISKIASATRAPQRVIGVHFFNPVPVMQLVEVIPCQETSKETLDQAKEWVLSLNKTPVVAKDYAGFIVNRVLCGMLNESFNVVMEGVSPEDVDTAMRLGTNVPMGPLTLADFVGNDTLLHILETLEEEFGERYKPSPLLRRIVEAGRFGRKVGKGVYEYDT